jgi:hypothetical protein
MNLRIPLLMLPPSLNSASKTQQPISDTEDAVANISVGDGHFSVKYLFPDDGTHQAITRLDTKNPVNLALFNIFVPHQSSGVPFPSSSSSEVSNRTQQVIMTAIIVGAISSVVVATIFLVKRK